MSGLDVGLWPDVPHAAYHGDPCIEPSLNASAALTLLNRSPLHCWHEHPRLGGKPSTRSSDAMDTGSLVHSLVLGGGADIVAVDADDWRTKAAKEARDNARASGKIAVLARRLDECREVASRLAGVVPNILARECTAVWRSGEALCRCRWDAFDSSGVIFDLKICEDAKRASEGRSVASNGYHLRAANQIEAAEAILPELAGRVTYRLIFAEPDPPYAIVEAELSRDFVELGRRRWHRAVTIWSRCFALDHWPGPGGDGGPLTIDAPPWAAAEDMEEQLRLHGGDDSASLDL